MAHCAEIKDGKVVRVIVVQDMYPGGASGGGAHYLSCEQWCEQMFGGTWKQTSYNTHGGKHPENRPLRKNYAGIGYTYDSVRDAFIPPKPEVGTWVLNELTCLWDEVKI